MTREARDESGGDAISDHAASQTTVVGERGAPSIDRARSVQSRLSSVLALGLMSTLGLGALTWYYANAMQRPGQSKSAAQAAAVNRAQGEMALPSLGRIEPPPATGSDARMIHDPPMAPGFAGRESLGMLGGQPIPPTPLAEIPLAPAPSPTAYGAAPVKTPAELALERQLSGAAFAAQPPSQAVLTAMATSGSLAGAAVGGSGAVGADGSAGGTADTGELSALLRPNVTAPVRAQVLPTRRLLMPKGAFIDCTLETAIDSTLPGMTTCILATDAFGADGTVVLLERGTKLTGETRGQVQQGAARLFVLWTEARTPTGVIVPLASPGADELGRSGLPGTVNHHFWERFGAALLVSVVDGTVQAAAQSSRGGGSAVILNPSSSQDVMTEVLKNTINIPPTIVKANGDRIQVLVARDVDFRSVYELHSVAGGR